MMFNGYTRKETLHIFTKFIDPTEKAPLKHFHVNLYNHPCITQETVPLASWPKSIYSQEFGLGEKEVFS